MVTVLRAKSPTTLLGIFTNMMYFKNTESFAVMKTLGVDRKKVKKS